MTGPPTPELEDLPSLYYDPGVIYMDPRDNSFATHDDRGNTASRWGGDGRSVPRVITKGNRSR